MWQILGICLIYFVCHGYTSDANGFMYKLERVNGDTQVQLSIMRRFEVVQQILFSEQFGQNMIFTAIQNGQSISGNGLQLSITTIRDTSTFTMIQISRTVPQTEQRRDCIRLESDRMSWYGGPQQKHQYWPVDKLQFQDYSYITKEADNCGIAERYWLNSRGSFIYISPDTPLFIDQNYQANELCFVAKKQLPYDTHTVGQFEFNYHIGMGINAKDAHMSAITEFLKKPVGHPAERMVQHPVWSTWARYSRDINEATVTSLADEIITNQFENSQFEIDDDWEICYGALEFRTSKFPNIKQLTDSLKAKGFKVTLWIHPFVNKDCLPYYTDFYNLGYLVKNHDGSADTQWWNSGTNEAAYLDFSKPAVQTWFAARLEKLRTEAGIDSFKFDAGETSWTPSDPVLQGTASRAPSIITTEYIRTVAKFGDLVEVRSGQNTQDLPIFVRMIDKDSEWGWNNGLPTLVTTLLQLNMVGYPLVLPDMIGGNGYNGAPSEEMFVRWLEANVFMPSLQYSFVPWDYSTPETITESRRLTALHAQYTSTIMTRFKLAVNTGEPVNPPLWWADPDDRTAQQVNDQFLLGDSIISAPVLQQGQTTRHVYLVKGQWRDGNNGSIYTGPRWLMDYPAPLYVLPYFIKV